MKKDLKYKFQINSYNKIVDRGDLIININIDCVLKNKISYYLWEHIAEFLDHNIISNIHTNLIINTEEV